MAQQQTRKEPEFMQEDEIDLGEYLGVLLDAKWLILSIGLLIAGLAGLYAVLATPIYQADAVVQVETKSPSMGAATDLMSMMDQGGSSAATEIEILKTRSILFKVVQNLRLDLVARPVLFPVVGAYFHRTYADEGFREPVLGLSDYAWGGERIKLERLDLPASLRGEDLRVLCTGEHRFALYHDDVLLLKGVVGQLAENAALGIKVFLSQLEARQGVGFVISKASVEDVAAAYLRVLSIAEQGKGTGILKLSLTGADPVLLQQFLNDLAAVYLRQNVERKTEESKNSLLFLQKQLPKVRSQLEAAEARLNDYRLQSGSINLTLETQGVLSKMVDLEQQLSSLELKRSELLQRFKTTHPLLQALAHQEEQLLHDKLQLQEKVKALPATEQKILTLMRDVKVSTELYTFLLNKTQELKVVEAGTIGNVRILDLALLPGTPIKPKKSLIVILGLFIGLFLAVIMVFIRKAMHQGVEDPELLEQKTGLSVFASIPHSSLQETLHAKMKKRDHGEASLLALIDADDLAIESLRSLRTNLHFALMGADNNRMMLTGPAPGLGKSFVSANLAAVLASAKQRVLIIDGDMRKGHLHDYFNLQRSPGLSGVLAGHVDFEEACHATAVEGLFVMPTGKLPPNPADLLMSESFDALLEQASKAFDMVFIDTPPVLAVTDAVLIAKRSAVCFMLLRSGRHPMQEIDYALKQMSTAGIKITGLIFNDIMPKRSSYGYGSYKYHYQYSYKKSE